MKILKLCLASFIFIISLDASSFEFTDIVKWVGKYPKDKVAGLDFFSTKEFNDYVQKILGRERFAEFLRIREYGPKTPLIQTGDFVHFTLCEQHNCGHMFYFFTDVKKSELFICEREFIISDTITTSATWYGLNKSIKMESNRCEVFNTKTEDTDWEKTILSIPMEI